MKFVIEIDCPKKHEVMVWEVTCALIRAAKLAIEALDKKVNFSIQGSR